MSNCRKNTQRSFNHIVKEINKGIEKDELWRGRFIIHQVRAEWENFSDNSGGILYTIIRVYDKKTKKYRDYCVEYMKGQRMSWELEMNILTEFIVKGVNVWTNENPYEDKTDYTKINTPNDICSYPLSFILPNEWRE